MLKCPFCYKKSQNLQPRRDALIIDSSLVNFCKPIYVTLACFFCNSHLFRLICLVYFHIIFIAPFNLIYMTAVTFPLSPPRLALATCGRRWQNDVCKIKVYNNMLFGFASINDPGN